MTFRGQILHSLGDELSYELGTCLPIFLERLKNEITRLTTVKALTLIAGYEAIGSHISFPNFRNIKYRKYGRLPITFSILSICVEHFPCTVNIVILSLSVDLH